MEEDMSRNTCIVSQDSRKVTSFEGILQNGISDPSVCATGAPVINCTGNDTRVVAVASEADTAALLNNISVTNNNNSSESSTDGVHPKKNVLADLLEKTVGGDILNGVVDKEIRLSNGPLNNVTVSGGVKRPGADDFDDSGGGTKRLAIDRGDGKITLYVSQNGGSDGVNVNTADGGGIVNPQQVVFSGQGVANIIAVSTAMSTPRQMVTSQGQMVASGAQLITSGGQLISSTGQLVTSGGQLLTPGAQLVTSSGQLISAGGQLMATPSGQLVTAQNGQKVMVQSNFSQVLGGQVVLSQGGHLVVGGNTSGAGSETVLVGGQVTPQVVSQIAGQAPTQILGPGGQVITQSPQQVVATNQGRIISQGQTAILPQGSNTGHVISQGQLISQGQGQLLQTQGQIISQGPNQLVGAGAGQIITTPSGQIVGQVTQAGQIVGQVNSAGQLVGQVNQTGQIVNQVNQANQVVTQGGQIIGQVNQAGQIVTQGSAVVSQGGTLLVQQSGTSGKTLIILPPGQKVLQQPGQHSIVMQHQSVGAGTPVVQVQQPASSVGQIVQVQQQPQQPNASSGQVLQVVTNSAAVAGGVVRSIAPQGVGVIASNTNLSNSNGNSQQPSVLTPQTPVAASVVSSSLKLPTATSGSAMTTVSRGPLNTAPNSVTPQPSVPLVPAPQILASGIVRRNPVAPSPGPASASSIGIHSNPPKPGALQYLCEWRGCNSIFASPQQVYHHVCKIHCPPHLVEIQCQWAGCDPMVRKRFSTMTHLHDRHCNEQLLNVLAVRRQQIALSGKTDLPIPHTPPPHPGYAPNAAFHAIKRHALEVINQRDAIEKEGPVTKSIRLTSALVLRNLVIYSNSGRKLLRGYESELCNVAISTQESSRTVAQILHDLHISDQ